MNYGWSYNPDRIAAAAERMLAAGCTVSFDADRPAMRGYWPRQVARGVTAVLAQSDELKVTGSWRSPNSQQRGTCVGQGSSRAIEDVHISRLADQAIVGKYVQIAYEPMYGHERKAHWPKTHPWGCTCRNCPDGLQGHDAAEFYAVQGAIARGNYPQAGIDLTSPREDLAILWNNTGVPDSLIAAGAVHPIECHSSASWTEYADPIASKQWGHVCLPRIFQGTRVDRYGCCEPDGYGGHCTECCGIVVLSSGETAFIMQQSWGSASKYPTAIHTAAGPIKLRPGSYAVRQSILESIGNQIELISCDIPSRSSFR